MIDITLYRDGAAYIDGRYLPIGEATISVTDWGLTRSNAVYDMVHFFGGSFFRLSDDLKRFRASMLARRLMLAEDHTAIESVLHQVVTSTGLQNAYAAMVAMRGRPCVAGSRRPQDCANYLIAYALLSIDVIPKTTQARGTRFGLLHPHESFPTGAWPAST